MIIEAFRRLVVGGHESGDRSRGHSIRERHSRRPVTVEMLEGRMMLSGVPLSNLAHLTSPAHLQQPPLSIQQQAAVDLFATLDSVRGSGTVTPGEIASVQQDISLIFASAAPSSSTVTTFLNDYQSATVGRSLTTTSVATLKCDLTAMLGSANVSMGQFRGFLLTQTQPIRGFSGSPTFHPSFYDVKSIVA
jgi:hypothetical protein